MCTWANFAYIIMNLVHSHENSYIVVRFVLCINILVLVMYICIDPLLQHMFMFGNVYMYKLFHLQNWFNTLNMFTEIISLLQ